MHNEVVYVSPVIKMAGVIRRTGRPLNLLWPWTWPDNLRIRTWPVFPGDTPDVQIWTSYVKAFESYRLTDRQTDTIISCRFAGGR